MDHVEDLRKLHLEIILVRASVKGERPAEI
jgi:hypothetical protein